MDDAVAGMVFRAEQLGIFNGIQRHFHCPVSDGVDGHRHIVAVGAQYQAVELRLGEHLQTLGGGIVGVGLAHGGGAGAQAAVGQQLDAAGTEPGRAPLVVIAGVKEFLDQLFLLQQALFAHPDVECALGLQLGKGAEEQMVVGLGGIAHIVALQRGDALAQGFLLGGEDDLFQRLQVQAGDLGLGVIQQAFFDDAVGLAVFVHFHQIAIGGSGLPGDVQRFQGGGVEHADVEAGPHDHHGHGGGHLIQVGPQGEAALAFGEIVLVPAFSFYKSIGAGGTQTGAFGHPLLNFLNRMGAGEVDAHQAFGKMDEMHMGIVEAGEHQPVFGVHFLGLLATAAQLHLGSFQRTHKDKPVVFDESGLGHRAPVIHGVDAGIFDQGKHGVFLLFFCKNRIAIVFESRRSHYITPICIPGRKRKNRENATNLYKSFWSRC